ncbi:MAG: galactokinase [Microthrixaceae bacterium]|nr:galactokinase [Microthrixaceae bacterium]
MRVAVPGRVNLIGGHVDFHDGLVVSAAVDRYVTIEVAATGGPLVEICSEGFDGSVVVSASGEQRREAHLPSWGRLVASVLSELDSLGRPPGGFRAAVSSNLRAGGGLSSSAAFALAVAVVATRAVEWSADPLTLALACQRAEHAATGVPCGIQDQLAIVFGGVAQIDCRTLESEPLVLGEDVALLLVDSGVVRQLEHSPWADRRAESFRQSRLLGVELLRDMPSNADLDDLPLARHVVEEIGRVRDFAVALREGDMVGAGSLMTASHESSRDLWRSSLPQLDLLVDELVTAGAYGARLTGGGFGGSVVALCRAESAGAAADSASAAFERAFGERPTAHVVRPVVGLS